MSSAQKSNSASESVSNESSSRSQKELSEQDPPSISNDTRLRSYYHGLLPRGDIDPLLEKDGQFLVRKTEKDGNVVLALSVRWQGQPRHFIINEGDGQEYYFEKHAVGLNHQFHSDSWNFQEKTVHELIDWHRNTKTPLTTASGACIRSPVGRPPWILNHDNVKMTKKLGEGAFGEVFKATFIEDGKELEVAVKTMREAVSRDARLNFMKEVGRKKPLGHSRTRSL